jgi:hypothetical protein
VFLALAGCMAGVKATPGAGLGWQAENPGGRSTGRVGIDLGTYEVSGSAENIVNPAPLKAPEVTLVVDPPADTSAVLWTGLGLVAAAVAVSLFKRKAA